MPLYGAKGAASTTSDLYTIDPATAAASSIGPIGWAITGLAFDPTDGTLFGLTSKNSALNPNSILTIDTVTGAGTLVGASGLGGSQLTDIDFDTAGVLYALGQARILYSINKSTGAATPIGSAGASTAGGALAIDSANNGYAAPADFYSINLSTGALAFIGSFTGTMAAGSFDPTDVLYAILNPSTAHLVTVNVATGATTDIGATTGNMDGLAWSATGGGGGLSSPEGVCIAFTDPTLEPSPTWTRIDDGV